MNESSEEKSSEDEINLYKIKKNKKNIKLYTPSKNLVKKRKFLINGSMNRKMNDKSNGVSKLPINRYKSNNIKNNKIYLTKNNVNNENISNGETNSKKDEQFKDNYHLISKKLLLISKKEKKNINKEKNNNIKNISKTQTSKSLNKLTTNIEVEEENVKDNKKSKLFERLKTHKSKTALYEHKEKNDVKYNINDIIQSNNKPIIYEYSKFRNRNLLKTEKKVTKTQDNNNFVLPYLTISKPITDRQYFMKNKDNNTRTLYKSYNHKIKESSTFRGEKKFSFPKNTLNINTTATTKNIINHKSSFYLKQKRKETVDSENSKVDLISDKLLKTFKLNAEKNKFLNKLKQNLKDEHPNYFMDNWKKIKKNEISSSLIFVEKKINNWVSEFPMNKNKSGEKIIFDMKEYKKNKKDKKYFKIIINDFIRNISSIKFITDFYFSLHKGIIETNILIYLQNKFFDIHLPSYIFEYKYNKLYLSKIPTINQKKLFKKRIDSKVQFMTYKSNNSAKKRRLSSLEQFRKRSVKNVMMPLSEHEKKSILYLYYLDIDLDNNLQESITMENNDKDGFLELLRGNLNKTEAQDLLINKFITIYIKKNGTRNKALIYNKKNSIKNNNVINKGLTLNNSIKNKSPLFKNNFFSRNEIKRSSYKIDKQKKKKSVLEYNLLFDPSLTGYNNLITDTDIVFDPNNQKTIINKRKIKEIQRLKNKQLTSFFISSGGMKTDKNLIVMKTLDLKNQYNHKNKGNINSLTSSIKDCNYDSFVKFYRTCKCGPNAKDKEGNSLLSLAVKSSCLEIVDFLLEEKANPNLQNVSKYYIYLFFIYKL